MRTIFGNLGIASGENTVELSLGAATPSRSCLFTAREIDGLCDLLRKAASEAQPKQDAEDMFGDLL